MNLAKIARILAGFALFFSLVQAIPLAYAIWFEGGVTGGIHPRQGFVTSMAIGAICTVVLWILGRSDSDEFYRRESLAVVGLAWLLSCALGAVPFYASGALTPITDALFEGVSGLTTTGASVFGTADNPSISELPRSILLWRALLQWLGGLGIILAFMVLLPAMGVTGKSLLSSEQVGVVSGNVRPRMQKQARKLFAVYIVLSVADAIALRFAGLSTFDAVCHALTTLATGGFSTQDYSVGTFHNAPAEVITIAFMFLGGTSFVLLLGAAARPRSGGGAEILKNPEFRFYVGLTLGLILAVTAILRVWGVEMPDASTTGGTRAYHDLTRCLRDASFQVVSILTSTGYSTADFQNWPKPALFLLIFAAFVGGCSGSTSGGLKIVRLVVNIKLMVYGLRHFVRPKSIEKIRVGSNVVSNSIVSAILVLTLMWVAVAVLGALALALDPRLDMLSAISASVSMISCNGPAITEVVALGADFRVANAGDINLGPFGGYGDLHSASKLLMCLQMVLGRLEILGFLVLLIPGFWRNR